MKNDYCDLPKDQIRALPERFIGFLLSPFQFNLHNEMVAVPEDTFKEMIDIIAEYAVLTQQGASRAALDDAVRALEGYADSYDMMTRIGHETVDTRSVAHDIRRNMVNAVRAALARAPLPAQADGQAVDDALGEVDALASDALIPRRTLAEMRMRLKQIIVEVRAAQSRAQSDTTGENHG